MKKLFSAMVLLTLMTQFSTYVLGCTGVIVGKGLTTDGSFIFGRMRIF